MDITKIMSIISMMPIKKQKAVLSMANFDGRPTKMIWNDILDMAISLANQHDKEILTIYKSVPIPDDIIEKAFGGLYDTNKPLSYTDAQLTWIQEHVYRNLAGEFRIIPNCGTATIDDMPIDGLKTDEDILSGRLYLSRKTSVGTLEHFDGFESIKRQHYEPPYEGLYEMLAPNLQRIKIISSFEQADPTGFFKRDGRICRNIGYKITDVDKNLVSIDGLKRALLLMYFVSGATQEAWRTLYALIHFMVRCPNSATGYIIYLNDFDAGGNGKSKFVSILQHMFGDAFTAFEPHQLRFNISLMGKRLVHISEYEDNETSKQLLGMLKAMTGRDKFQYEGKGQDPIVAETYQNFIISSNRYIYFDDAAVKRRLQNFHCSNFLHLLLTKYYKSSKYLNKLLGNPFLNESKQILLEMSHSLLNYILNDELAYDIPLRTQTIVLGSLRNPILRYIFSERFNTDGCVRENGDGSAMDLMRIEPDAKPEQYNYAANMLLQWMADLTLKTTRDNLTIMSDLPANVFIQKLKTRIKELDESSVGLRSRNQVFIEEATLCNFNSLELIGEFFDCSDLNMTTTKTGVIIQ